MEDLAADRKLLIRVGGWAAANWMLDIAALWIFLRAYGPAPDIDALIVAFGLVNVLAVIPLLPGGLGTIDIGLPLALGGFGVSRATAVLGVGTYRLAQFFFPIVLGGLMYTSLRVGPWSIERRDRLRRLRDLAAEHDGNSESALDFSARFERRRSQQKAAIGLGMLEGTFDPTQADGVDIESFLKDDDAVASPVEAIVAHDDPTHPDPEHPDHVGLDQVRPDPDSAHVDETDV